MAASFFSQPPVAYFQPLESPPNACRPSFISTDNLTEFETIHSNICDWAGELRKDHDLHQRADHCSWLFSEQSAPFKVCKELPSSALIPAAQRQPHVDFLSSDSAIKSLFHAASDAGSDVGVMVHRLGDWLVIDDGTEFSKYLDLGGSPDPVGVENLLRKAEQRQRSAKLRAETLEVRVAEAQQCLEFARAALIQAEAEAQAASDALHEAMKEVRLAKDECDSLRCSALGQARAAAERAVKEHAATSSRMSAAAATGAERSGLGTRARTVFGMPKAAAHPPRDQAIDKEAPEERQLYRNLLGHSIRTLREQEQLGEMSSESVTPTAGDAEEESIAAVDGPAAFRQVGIWKIAGDASVVVGSRMLCLGNAEHPKLALYLHDPRTFSDSMLLDHWVECLIAGVPEFAICFHTAGTVQSYSLYKLSELWNLLDERLAIGRKLQMMLEVLRWIRRRCLSEGCTYYLSKAGNEPTLKLFKIEARAGSGVRRPTSPAKPALEWAGVPAPLGEELVVKNTFLDVASCVDDVDGVDSRRSQSCPARMCNPPATEEDAASMPCTEDGVPDWQSFESLQQRVPTLFFRRATALPPGASAARFFQCALDFETRITETGVPQIGERLFFQAHCHLGLALCELSDGSHGIGKDSAAGLLAALRGDAPALGMVDQMCDKYRLQPLHGTVQRTALLFIGLSPWPWRLFGDQEPRPNVLACSTSLKHIVSALMLLVASVPNTAPECQTDAQRDVEAVLFSLASLSLLYLASALMRGHWDGPSSRSVVAMEEVDLATKVLLLAQKFAALTAVRSETSAPQSSFFACLPPLQELYVRIEHLLGSALLMKAALLGQADHRAAHAAAAAEVHAERLPPSPASSTSSGVPIEMLAPAGDSLLCSVQTTVSKLQDWIGAHDHQAAEAMKVLTATLGKLSVMKDDMMSLDDNGLQYTQQMHAAWHYERSIRLLPTSAQHPGPVLDQMILVFATALAMAAASLAAGVHVRDSPDTSYSLQTLVRAEEHLLQAESLLDAAGRDAIAALTQAGRGHLRGLAADLLAGETGLGARRLPALSALDEAALYSLCDVDTGQADWSNAGQCVGRLGDLAIAMCAEAQQSVDSDIEQDVAGVLTLMSSGAMQAAAMRLWAFPPLGMEVTDCRQAVTDMVARSLQLLPNTNHGSCSQGIGSAGIGPRLSAHAHLMQAEMQIEIRSQASFEKTQQQRHQRVSWHLEKARSALHGAEDDGVLALVLLAHLHAAHAQLICQGPGASRKQLEHALEELLSGCRVAASMGQAGWPTTLHAGAQDEMCRLLLHGLRKTLHELCARELKESQASGEAAAATSNASSSTTYQGASHSATSGPWKTLYRAVLQLTPAAVASVPELHSSIVKRPL